MDYTPNRPPEGSKSELKEVSDAELVKIALKGNKTAFQELVERYYKPVFGYIYLKTFSHHASEDITQETFLRGYQLLRKLAGKPNKFPGWIFNIAGKCCSEWRRQEGKAISREGKDLDITVKPPAKANPAVENLLEQMEKLPEPYYLVLAMKYQKGMTAEEIARATGQALGTVTSMLTRAYKLLRKELGK